MSAASCKAVVGTLMSNLGLELALADLGIPFVRANVGDRYVIAGLYKSAIGKLVAKTRAILSAFSTQLPVMRLLRFRYCCLCVVVKKARLVPALWSANALRFC